MGKFGQKNRRRAYDTPWDCYRRLKKGAKSSPHQSIKKHSGGSSFGMPKTEKATVVFKNYSWCIDNKVEICYHMYWLNSAVWFLRSAFNYKTLILWWKRMTQMIKMRVRFLHLTTERLLCSGYTAGQEKAQNRQYIVGRQIKRDANCRLFFHILSLWLRSAACKRAFLPKARHIVASREAALKYKGLWSPLRDPQPM